jgi:hypothetical protein
VPFMGQLPDHNSPWGILSTLGTQRCLGLTHQSTGGFKAGAVLCGIWGQSRLEQIGVRITTV